MVTRHAISQRSGAWLRMAVVLSCCLLTLLSGAMAHEIRPAVVNILLQDDGRFEIRVRLNLEAMLAGIGTTHSDSDDAGNAPVYNRLRELPPADLQAEFSRSRQGFLDGLDVHSGDARVQPALQGVVIPEVGDTGLARDSIISLSGRLPSGSQSLTWRWDERFGATVVRVDAEDGGEVYTAYLQPGTRSEAIASRQPVSQSAWGVFKDYIAVGFEHIVPKGLDHMLFVVGLFLLSPRWQVLLWQVTAFTLAHTITLALSMLGWVQLPAAIVEPLIAASIVYICVENLYHERLTRWRPLVVFGFGLLHGLGFASVLTDIGLSPGHFVAGLVGFNIGVELGQLAVLAVCFLSVGLWFQHRTWYRRGVTIPGSLLIAGVASYWFVERTLLA